jgi:hypothetical protein
MNDRTYALMSSIGLLFLGTTLLVLVAPRLRRIAVATNGIIAAVAALFVDGPLATLTLLTTAAAVAVWFATGARPISFGRR